jgi:hypothetical protein
MHDPPFVLQALERGCEQPHGGCPTARAADTSPATSVRSRPGRRSRRARGHVRIPESAPPLWKSPPRRILETLQRASDRIALWSCPRLASTRVLRGAPRLPSLPQPPPTTGFERVMVAVHLTTCTERAPASVCLAL